MKISAVPLLALVIVIGNMIPVFASAQVPSREVAAPTNEQVQVSKTNFKINNGWWEAEVELTVRPVSGDFVDRVRVVLSLGVEAQPSATAEKRQVFYRSSVEYVTLERSRGTVARFYLPPEVVKRDRLRAEAPFFLVELEAAGEAQKPTPASVSRTTIPTPEILASFRSKVATEAPANDGILVPRHLTPFAGFDLPTPVRREAGR